MPLWFTGGPVRGKSLQRACCALVIGLEIAMIAVAQGESGVAAEISFDIPAQPLADAVVNYSAVTGLQIYYDGALAIDRRSTAVRGRFPSATALRILLRGTGYVVRAADSPDTFTIVAAPDKTFPEAVAGAEHYDQFLASLQSRVDGALCASAGASGDMTVVSLWVARSGIVSRVRVFGLEEKEAQRDRMITAIQGLDLAEAPPPAMPQPVTIAIYPRSGHESASCDSAGMQIRDRAR